MMKLYIAKNQVKLELKYIEYFFAIFVTNHVLKQEINIVFKFFNQLIDVLLKDKEKDPLPH